MSDSTLRLVSSSSSKSEGQISGRSVLLPPGSEIGAAVGVGKATPAIEGRTQEGRPAAQLMVAARALLLLVLTEGRTMSLLREEISMRLFLLGPFVDRRDQRTFRRICFSGAEVVTMGWSEGVVETGIRRRWSHAVGQRRIGCSGVLTTRGRGLINFLISDVLMDSRLGVVVGFDWTSIVFWQDARRLWDDRWDWSRGADAMNPT